MLRSRLGRTGFLLTLVITVPALACLWDYDTLKDEKRGLPGIAEILAGRWEKHSTFFYEHRATTMRELIAREPKNLAAYDNLAVALQKLGKTDEAIQVMMEKELVQPGEYTTYANLGTFYMFKGHFDRASETIAKALQINPDAHFGREEYQLKLAQFLRDTHIDPARHVGENFLGIGPTGRGMYPAEVSARVATRAATGPADPTSDQREHFYWLYRASPGSFAELHLKPNVFDGIVGMVRFGTDRSAELYLTLGDLLALRGDKHLAYRAYQRALDLNHPRTAYLQSVMQAIEQLVESHNELNATAIARERSDAEEWVKAYQVFEDGLIREGKDPELESNLAPFYQVHGRARAEIVSELSDLLPRSSEGQFALQAGLVLVPAGIAFIYWLRRRRRRRVAR